MGQAQARFRFVRMPSRKVRVVLNLIRGKSITQAFTILKFTNRRACEMIGKLLNSAVDNAVKDQKLKKEDLYVKGCAADGGPMMKRFQPRAYGRASMKHKRFSHVRLVVAEK